VLDDRLDGSLGIGSKPSRKLVQKIGFILTYGYDQFAQMQLRETATKRQPRLAVHEKGGKRGNEDIP
jgi:hypothetical protein